MSHMLTLAQAAALATLAIVREMLAWTQHSKFCSLTGAHGLKHFCFWVRETEKWGRPLIGWESISPGNQSGSSQAFGKDKPPPCLLTTCRRCHGKLTKSFLARSSLSPRALSRGQTVTRRPRSHLG